MVTVKPNLLTTHILVVDGNPEELRLLVEKLRGKGYRVSMAFDGAHGYERAVAGVPDLILLDAQMPKMDGFATCRKLKANPSLARIPVIFLGVSHSADGRMMALETGGVDYLLRPFALEEVLARIRIHLAPANTGHASDAPEETTACKLTDDEVLVRAAQQYVAANLANIPSLGYLARLLGTNEKRLSRAFRKYAAMTVFEYLRQERMRTAQRLLKETMLSVVAISEEVGFSRATNFATAFREYTGVTPSEFRRRTITQAGPESMDTRRFYAGYANTGALPAFCGVFSRRSGA